MIIRIVLIVAILWIAWYFVATRGSSRSDAFKKLGLAGFVIAAIAAVIDPSLLTLLANQLGVGRGTDLLVYVLALITVFQLFNSYVKDKHHRKQVALLARRVALLDAHMHRRDSAAESPATGRQQTSQQ